MSSRQTLDKKVFSTDNWFIGCKKCGETPCSTRGGGATVLGPTRVRVWIKRPPYLSPGYIPMRVWNEERLLDLPPGATFEERKIPNPYFDQQAYYPVWDPPRPNEAPPDIYHHQDFQTDTPLPFESGSAVNDFFVGAMSEKGIVKTEPANYYPVITRGEGHRVGHGGHGWERKRLSVMWKKGTDNKPRYIDVPGAD